MKIHEIRFVNYYTTAEVESFAELRDLRDAQELRIHIPLEDKRLAYFEVQRIEHPNWAFKSTCVQFTGWEDEVEFFREKALQFVQAHVQALVENAVVELSLPPQVSSGKPSPEHEQLFLQLSRPFMYPFTQLDTFLKRLGRMVGRNMEMEFLLAWRSDNGFRNIQFLSAPLISMSINALLKASASLPGARPTTFFLSTSVNTVMYWWPFLVLVSSTPRCLTASKG